MHGCCLVQQEYAGRHQQSPGDGDALRGKIIMGRWGCAAWADHHGVVGHKAGAQGRSFT